MASPLDLGSRLQAGSTPAFPTKFMITVNDIKALREKTGSGIEQCRTALELCKEDANLAYYYLFYIECAVMVHGMNSHEWAMMMAEIKVEQDKQNNRGVPSRGNTG